MGLNIFKNTVLFPKIIGIVLVLISCGSNDRKKSAQNNEILKQVQDDKVVIVGANQTENYLLLLSGKKVGIVANQTSVIFKDGRQKTGDGSFTHLVDSLLSLDIDVKKVFAPEHGFRGTADAGEKVKDGIDTKTGLPIISLYGKNRKPSTEQLENIDILIFDIQDVGARFYTYISTLHYVMEACAEQNIPLLILDRPNPNGHYVDGPILEMEHKSFVGMHPVPVVHGMTIGEYAQMINGEQWLENRVQCDITVIPIKSYTHNTSYSLPIKPSPNLPNDKAINLYPSLCFFEGTNVSIGRGTDKQFQVYGSPFMSGEYINYCFTPQPNFGAKYPKHQGKECCGSDLSEEEEHNEIRLGYLIEAYSSTLNKEDFFNDFLTKLAGTKKLQQQIEAGLTEKEIKATWQDGLESFKIIRKKYLIYR
ncbi:MAG: DUF1343 domain-containing protein [Flavobacteriaceae bacterium]|nr:DUF1343 domain-containing protein [Flavobacteriaceae bacterium]